MPVEENISINTITTAAKMHIVDNNSIEIITIQTLLGDNYIKAQMQPQQQGKDFHKLQ